MLCFTAQTRIRYGVQRAAAMPSVRGEGEDASGCERRARARRAARAPRHGHATRLPRDLTHAGVLTQQHSKTRGGAVHSATAPALDELTRAQLMSRSGRSTLNVYRNCHEIGLSIIWLEL